MNALGIVHDGETWKAWFGLSVARTLRAVDLEICSVESGPLLSMGRNLLVEQFLATDCERLLMVDTDMVFGPKMVTDLFDHQVPIIGGLCFTGPYQILPTLWRDGHRARYEAGRLMAVEATGAAFLAVHRKVFEAMGPPWFMFTYEDGIQVGEDLWFCRQAIRRGFEILVDTKIKPGHMKSRPWGERDYKRLPPGDRLQETCPE